MQSVVLPISECLSVLLSIIYHHFCERLGICILYIHFYRIPFDFLFEIEIQRNMQKRKKAVRSAYIAHTAMLINFIYLCVWWCWSTAVVCVSFICFSTKWFIHVKAPLTYIIISINANSEATEGEDGKIFHLSNHSRENWTKKCIILIYL